MMTLIKMQSPGITEGNQGVHEQGLNACCLPSADLYVATRITRLREPLYGSKTLRCAS